MTKFRNEQDAIQRFNDVLTRVDYPKFFFVVSASKTGAFYFQIECSDTCNHTGEPLEWKSRKWLLSEHGVSIFDPHYDIEKLVELRRSPSSLKERTPK